MAGKQQSDGEAVFFMLSPQARCLTYKAWLEIGGCGFPNYAGDPMARAKVYMRKKDQATLGEIADADPFTGRSFARFAVEILRRRDLAVGPFTADQLRKFEHRAGALPDDLPPALLAADDLAQERALTREIFNDPTIIREKRWAQAGLWSAMMEDDAPW